MVDPTKKEHIYLPTHFCLSKRLAINANLNSFGEKDSPESSVGFEI